MESTGQALKAVQRFDPIWIDEAVDVLFSADASKRESKELVKGFQMIRGLNLFAIFCIPNWFALNKYFRLFRIRYLLVVKKRGLVAIYDKEAIRYVNKLVKK